MSFLHKKEKKRENKDRLLWLMMPMVAGILACMFCLVSMTWAWFTASVSIPTQTIQSATRSTAVTVYEVSGAGGNGGASKTPVKPKTAQTLALTEEAKTNAESASEVMAGDSLVWELAPEKSYEVIMTGSGTATSGYCEIDVSQTVSGQNTPETKIYRTSKFEKEDTVTFTYQTGGFSGTEGVTETAWKDYVENSEPPTITIASYWGEPAEKEEDDKKIIPLSDGDVVGLAPIPCPEAKAETQVALEGFEVQEGAVISAEEDYKISLTLKEGYSMPGEVVVNIDGTDYVVSTGTAEAGGNAPYFDAQTGILTVPSALLSDGIMVSVKATASQLPKEEPEEETEEEPEENTDEDATEEDNTADTSADDVIADDPAKKEEDGEDGNSEPEKTPAGDGGDDGDDKTEKTPGSLTTAKPSYSGSSAGNHEEKAEEEKADVTLNLSQLTINLEETKIPTNADLVLTLSAKEDMELPEQIVITLDKTVYDETMDAEEIVEDKTEYVINTDGMDNPEGFEFDVEKGELKISSELLAGVREITIADTEENKEGEDEEDTVSLTFEVKNLTFDFTDDEIVTDEDVVITFTAGEGYELPETIVITIDDKEYIIYTSAEDSEKNPEGITFDIETGTLTVSKDLLEEAEAITIAAEGVKKEDEENTEGENNDEPNIGGGDDPDDDEPIGKEPEEGTDVPGVGGENEGGTETPESGTENTEPSSPESGDNTVPENPEPTTPENGDNTGTETGGENTGAGENGSGSTENGTEDNIGSASGPENGDDDKTTETEPTPPAGSDEPNATPEAEGTNEPSKDEAYSDDNGETGSKDDDLPEGKAVDENGSEDENAESGASNENSVSSLQDEATVPTAPLENKETADEE